MAQKSILLVTGLAGAGKTLALKTLEDMGFTCIDNMPLRLVPALISDPEALPDRLALGVDARTADIATHFTPAIEAIRTAAPEHSHILFLYADNEVLVRRFNETRRKHPLAGNDRPLAESVALERQVLATVRDAADITLDTTTFKPEELRRYLTDQYGAEAKGGMSVFIQSFGFKNGIPREADVVLDVRFLRNPHWDAALKPQTGQDPQVQAYIAADPAYTPTLTYFSDMLQHQLPLFEKSGKAYMTVAVGCTGGKHRSVMMAEALGEQLKTLPYALRVQHRDITKG